MDDSPYSLFHFKETFAHYFNYQFFGKNNRAVDKSGDERIVPTLQCFVFRSLAVDQSNWENAASQASIDAQCSPVHQATDGDYASDY